MIKIVRCAEPAKLAHIRVTQLAELRNLGRPPKSDEIDGYRLVAEELWASQYHKCCYCEARIPKCYNDVEHYRPKAEADRRPGCINTHGYWWLAFTWSNLLFACPSCNRSNKNSSFPLDAGSQTLMAEDFPPGNEVPLLIDPGSVINPVEHIQFVYQGIDLANTARTWWARPRNGSPAGNSTIEICGLNRAELREIRQDHYETVVLPHSVEINEAINTDDMPRLERSVLRAIQLFDPRNVHVGMSYDALRHLIPEANLFAKLGFGWPSPDVVGI